MVFDWGGCNVQWSPIQKTVKFLKNAKNARTIPHRRYAQWIYWGGDEMVDILKIAFSTSFSFMKWLYFD